MPLNTKTPELQVSLSSAYSCSMGERTAPAGPQPAVLQGIACWDTCKQVSSAQKCVIQDTFTVLDRYLQQQQKNINFYLS